MKRIARYGLWIVIATLVGTPSAFARIRKTRPSVSSYWSTLPLTVGSGFEFETDAEETDYDFPVLAEYNLLENLKFIVEPNFAIVNSKTPDIKSASGFGELETSVEYEFIPERRYRPALSTEATVKWPTASDTTLGSGKYDYTIGLIFSKDLVVVDLDFNVLYTFVGGSGDTIEISLGAEKDLNHFLVLETEGVGTIGSGGIQGTPGLGSPGSGETGFEALVGFAEHINRYLKFEEGGIIRHDLSWQIVFAWEWNFSGED